MAKGKRSVRKKGKQQKQPKNPYAPNAPFNATNPGYETNADFNQAVKREVGRQVKPQLGEVTRNQRSESRRTRSRQQDIRGQYHAYEDELQRAYDEMNASLGSLIEAHSASDQSAQGNLATALGNTANEDRARQATITGGVPQTQLGTEPAGIMAGVGATTSGNDAALLTNFGAMTGNAARDVGLAGLGRIRASESEARRHRGAVQDLQTRENQIRGQIPNLRQTVSQMLRQQAAQLQNQRFTQRLARDQFASQKQNQKFTQDLARDQFKLQKRQFKHQKVVDNANIAFNRAQLQQQADQLQAQIDQAKSGDQKNNAELKAKAWSNGVEALNNYLAPQNKAEKKKPNIIENNRRPAAVYRILRKRIGLGRHQALQLIHSVDYAGWHHWTPEKQKQIEDIYKLGSGGVKMHDRSGRRSVPRSAHHGPYSR